jgi:hypothetical protein
MVTICDSGLSDVKIIHNTGIAHNAARMSARVKRGSVFRTLRGMIGRAEGTVAVVIIRLR